MPTTKKESPKRARVDLTPEMVNFLLDCVEARDWRSFSDADSRNWGRCMMQLETALDRF